MTPSSSPWLARNRAPTAYAARARVVSFDRPYPLEWGYGAADLIGAELPLIRLLERYGADISYCTDIDLHRRPDTPLAHRAVLSLGHDEYWSTPMYDGALRSRDAGVNWAFFGANAVYRHIRLSDGPTGPDRLQVCYKDPGEDPLLGHDNTEVTANWPTGPHPRPEGVLIGDSYASNPVDAALRPVTDHWIWHGTGLAATAELPHVVGSEYDHYDPTVTGVPLNTDIIAHSPVADHRRPDHADATWYTTPHAGGVFATGTNNWVNRLSDVPDGPLRALLPAPEPTVTPALQHATLTVLGVLGASPAAHTRPSTGTWRQHYTATGQSLT